MPRVEYQYEGTPSQVWTDKAYELQVKGAIHAVLLVKGGTSRLVAGGECPRCRGHFSVDRASEIPIVKGGTRGPHDEDEWAAAVVTCNGPDVEGTPPDRDGCGATFTVYARIDTVAAR